MRHFPFLPLFSLCGSVLISFSVYAELYKWVDEDGNVNYTQTRPNTDVDIKEIKPPPKVDTEAANKEFKQQRKVVEKFTKEREEAAEKGQATAKEAEEKAAKCKQAKARLASYQRPRINVKQADGSLRSLSEEARQAEIAKSKSYVDKLCN